MTLINWVLIAMGAFTGTLSLLLHVGPTNTINYNIFSIKLLYYFNSK